MLGATKGHYPIYRAEYFIYVFVSLAIVALALFLIKKFVKKEEHLDRIIMVMAVIWLLLGIGNRISEVCDDILKYQVEGVTWKNLIPFTYCSLISIATPIAILISKGRGKSLHFWVYFGMLGSIITYIYPSWMAEYEFTDVSNYFSWIHHTVMLFMCLLLLITKRVVPSVKKFYIMPIGYLLVVLYGLFLVTAIKIKNSMCIVEPLISSSLFLAVMTSWYGVLILFSILLMVFLFIYEKIVNKITVKEFFLQLLRIHK